MNKKVIDLKIISQPTLAANCNINRSVKLATGTLFALMGTSEITSIAQALAEPVSAPLSGQAIGPPSFAEVAERVTPAVVNVKITAKINRIPRGELHGRPDLPDDLPLPEFFRRFFEGRGDFSPHQIEGQGSGFIIDAEGHIVTNNHVIEPASEVTVILNDGENFPAKIVGRDDKTDLALLKIEVKHPLPYVEFGDSSKARIGDWVLAVGNPFGLGGSVNAGILSARGRDIQSGPYDDYLQIDAAINRGNSGGPLFDSSGRVIGVNTAIYSPTGGNIGIGFAIPAETARQVINQLRSSGQVERGWLGIQIQEVTPELANALGLAQPSGVLVAAILPDGPASHSSLRAGDVILKVDGQPLAIYKDLPRLVAATKAGSQIKLDLLRDGKPLQMEITVGKMPTEESNTTVNKPGNEERDHAQLGLFLSSLTPELRQQKGFAPDRQGVYVNQVVPDSPAAHAGIEAGSLISMVGTEPVTTPEQIQAAVKEANNQKRKSLVLRIERDDRALFVAVPLE